MRFRLGTPPPLAGLWGVPPFHFVWVFAFCLVPPAAMISLREGFDFRFPCLRACLLLQFAFIRLAPHATPMMRGRVMTVVGLAIAPFSSRPPATLAVRGRFRRMVCLLIVSAFPSITSFAFSWLHTQAV